MRLVHLVKSLLFFFVVFFAMLSHALAGPQSHLGAAVRVCDGDSHGVPACSEKPGHLLYLLLAAHSHMVLCPQGVSSTRG